MPADSRVRLTIAFNDPDLDSEDLEEQAQNLRAQMKDLDEIEKVERVLDPNPPAGSKAAGALLVGLLTADVNPANVKKLLGFLGNCIGNKPIELEVEANGKRLKVKAKNQEELMAAIAAAEKFIAP